MVSNSHPPSSQLETSKNDNENNEVSTVSFNISTPANREVKRENMGDRTTIGKKTDTWIQRPVLDLPVKGGYVGLNESGTQRIGQHHARAKLTDEEVDAIRDEYEAGQEGKGPRIGHQLFCNVYARYRARARLSIDVLDRRNRVARYRSH